jgi:hypothetical protein
MGLKTSAIVQPLVGLELKMQRISTCSTVRRY